MVSLRQLWPYEGRESPGVLSNISTMKLNRRSGHAYILETDQFPCIFLQLMIPSFHTYSYGHSACLCVTVFARHHTHLPSINADSVESLAQSTTPPNQPLLRLTSDCHYLLPRYYPGLSCASDWSTDPLQRALPTGAKLFLIHALRASNYLDVACWKTLRSRQHWRRVLSSHFLDKRVMPGSNVGSKDLDHLVRVESVGLDGAPSDTVED